MNDYGDCTTYRRLLMFSPHESANMSALVNYPLLGVKQNIDGQVGGNNARA